MENLLGNFKQKLVEVTNKESIENENSRRPYIIGVMGDNRSDSRKVSIFSMSNYRGAVMPLVARGNTPNWDSFAPVKASDLELMHFWVQAPHTEYTIAWAERIINSKLKQGASSSQIDDFIAEIYAKLYLDRIYRRNDLLALQVGQCLSNFTLDDASNTTSGFISQGLIKQNDIFSYKIEGLEPVIDGTVIPADYNPIKFLIDKLVTSSKSEVNEIWMGDAWATWFLSSPAWKEMHPTKLMMERKMEYTPAGTSTSVAAEGATLLYEYDGIKFVHITKKATVLFQADANSPVERITKPVFNSDSIISLNTETLGSIVYCPPVFKQNPVSRMISNNDKMNFYEVFDSVTPEKDSLYRSEGYCLGAITGTESIQRMTMKEV